MHLVVFVEEESAEHALWTLLPRLLGERQELEILRFNGKPRLLRELPARLRGYRRQNREDVGIAVLIDEDRAARDIAAHMQPERNRSASFQCFCQGVRALVEQGRGAATSKLATRRRPSSTPR